MRKMLGVAAALLATQASAALVPFENCLPSNYIYTQVSASNVQLQWVPQFVDAKFDVEDPAHNLVVTVWGNVTGKTGREDLPPPGSPLWDDDGYANGKIVDEPNPNAPVDERKATTLLSKVNVLTYTQYSDRDYFCRRILNDTCPIAPVFNKTALNDPFGRPAFNMSHDFYSAYTFSSFNPTFIILFGDSESTTIGCISTVVTPSLGSSADLVKYLPLAVLVFVGFATIFAAIFSPWGTSNVFNWTSNYGRDPDLLRLVTPGFGDCLQYIQFIVLTGSLTLAYPGFYQPIVGQGAWSALVFNESFVTPNATYYQSLQDGVYVLNGEFGLQRLVQLVGMANVQDVWAGMIIWLLVIIAIVLALIQGGFLFRWLLRFVTNDTEEDLRAKNLPFSLGNVIRIVFNYFLLPIVAISAFQLVVASQSASVLVAMAAITIILVVGFAIWLMLFIVRTKNRGHLFDHLPTVLTYGPLYNTYTDEAAPFAIVPIVLNVLRGIAIGAVQPSGVAQLVILAICEVVNVLTLYAFRPFHPPTSMNLYHAALSVLRFVSVLLMVAFVPTMGVTEGPKGWIGYAIFLIHACALLFLFWLNALATIIEVVARLCGAGNDDVTGQTRGGLRKIFGARQLARRVDRHGAQSRQSQLSSTAMLDRVESRMGYGRVRSESAADMGIIASHQRSSSAFDARSFDAYANAMGGITPTTPGESSTFSFVPPGQATRPQGMPESYYRQPRPRRRTLDEFGNQTPTKTRASIGSVDLTARRMSQTAYADTDTDGAPGLVSGPGPAAYAPVFAPRADYSTREVDEYYGMRGPALNSDSPGRKLGTGPADPTSSVAVATSWVKGLFGGKTKEKGKGFEVVRSARMPPAMQARGGAQSVEPPPEGIPVAMGVIRHGPIDSDDDDATSKVNRSRRGTVESVRGGLLDEDGQPRTPAEDQELDIGGLGITKEAPVLPDLDAGESFGIPSRFASRASTKPKHKAVITAAADADEVPDVPRKSSKRDSTSPRGFRRLEQSAENHHQDGADPEKQGYLLPEAAASTSATRLPFDRTASQKRLSGSSTAPTDDGASPLPSAGFGRDHSSERPSSFGHVHHHSISRVDPKEPVDLLGSAAEIVDDPTKPSPHSSVHRRR
ncbi:uncharacterized protein B0I36DRAFT_372694 [Microdochium trichocladiopsis]|uniref:Integral membrane protein n=1 Tax=Microdochium trichocladiopsis TaxID=1682393 RepID=A0A9P9BWB3_9PEZI|nr:uncharacterized protein B0I36DRAFT_372694 [Microdochium trichocladiopsis]KAH7034906.1 integral membrane protein [Microdochium trichocladiopsis]